MLPLANNATVAPRVCARTILLLGLSALALRLAAACLLPNAEQDGYSYAETIAQWSDQLLAGKFRVRDLFDFWLPLFQFSAALLNLCVGSPLLAGKLVSAICGAAACILVFAVTMQLTRSLVFAAVAFLLVLCNPLHVLYSAAAMTDVPFGCLVLASLWFVLRDRWIVAAIFAALAECVRLEGWTLLLVLPLLQLVRERKLPVATLSVLLLPPLLWLMVSYVATGDPLAYFAKRARYQTSYLDFYPSRHGFAWRDISQDLSCFLMGANPIAAGAILLAGGLSISPVKFPSLRSNWPVVAITTYAAGTFALFFVGYVTKLQPVFLPRYGLIFFVLGISLAVWLLQALTSQSGRRRVVPRLTIVCLLLFYLWSVRPQLDIIDKVRRDFRAQSEIAAMVRTELRQAGNATARCFSDDPAVRVLSGLPRDRFVRSETAAPSAQQSRENFDAYLRQQDARYLVFARMENSLPVRFYPDLGRSADAEIADFALVRVAFSPFGPDVWLYRSRSF